MQNAKKMILVSPEKLTRPSSMLSGHTEAGLLSVSTPGDLLSRLDTEMAEILHSPKFKDDTEKWKMYRQVLQRYLYFAREPYHLKSMEEMKQNYEDGSSSITELQLSTPNTSKTFTNFDERNQLSDTIIIRSVPKCYKKKAELLLEHLHDNAVGTRIFWDEKGHVSINGNIIPNSNIVDLMNEAMRYRKTTVNAHGRDQFIRLLRDIGTPLEFVGNSVLWKSIGKNSPTLRTSTPWKNIRSASTSSRRKKIPDTDDSTQFLSADNNEEGEEVDEETIKNWSKLRFKK